MAIWALGEAMTVASRTLEHKVFWTKFQGIGELLLVPSYLLLALCFPRIKDFMRERRWALAVIAALYVPWIFSLVALYATNLIYASYYLTDYGQGINVVRTPFFWFLTALGFAEIIASVVIFLRERGRSESVRGRKGLLILALAPIPMLAANAVQNLELNRVISTPQSSIIFVSMLAYGILRYGLFVDIHSVTKHALVNASVMLFDVAIFTIICVFYDYTFVCGF
jgi:MFS family permease